MNFAPGLVSEISVTYLELDAVETEKSDEVRASLRTTLLSATSSSTGLRFGGVGVLATEIFTLRGFLKKIKASWLFAITLIMSDDSL